MSVTPCITSTLGHALYILQLTDSDRGFSAKFEKSSQELEVTAGEVVVFATLMEYLLPLTEFNLFIQSRSTHDTDVAITVNDFMKCTADRATDYDMGFCTIVCELVM